MDEKTISTWGVAAVTGAISALISHVKMGARVSELEKDNDDHKKKTDEMSDKLNTIHSDVSFIRGQLSKGITIHADSTKD